MIDIAWINESNFKIDWDADKDLIGQNVELIQQVYALMMGWA